MGRIIASVFVLFAAALALMAQAAPTSTLIAKGAPDFGMWIPIMIIAVAVGVGIAMAYYAIATILGNSRLKAGAMYELSQVLGTVVILVIIFGVFSFYNAGVYSGYSNLNGAVRNICNPLDANQLAGSPIDFLNSSALTPGPTNAICTQLVEPGPGKGVTSNIDYSLAATYAIIANVTSQAGMSLNALNVFENYYNTVEGFNPVESICWPGTCAESNAYVGKIEYSYWPFYIYGKIRTGTLFIASEAELSFYMGMLELFAIVFALFAWPYALAAGLIMRASFLTRRAGGLIIAIVVVGLFFYPFLNMFEYASLTNANNPLSPLGANVLPYNSLPLMTLKGLSVEPVCSCPSGYTYSGNNECSSALSSTVRATCPSNVPVGSIDSSGREIYTYSTSRINFYVFPRLDYILNYNGCWPVNGSLLEQEALIAGSYVTPIYGLGLALRDSIGSFTGNLDFLSIGTPYFRCDPAHLLDSVLALSDFYGQTFVFMVLMPVLNVLMLLSAVKGLSALLGGDTSLLGLGRLV